MNECWTPSSKDENILRSTSSQVINSFKKGKVFLMDFWGQRRYQFSTIEFSLSTRFWVVNFFIFGHFQFFSESELQRHCHAADNRICNGIEDGRLSKYIGSKCPYFVPNPKFHLWSFIFESKSVLFWHKKPNTKGDLDFL